ncbi:YtzI protein [Fictibacillus barbaricus]|nr:YtzI protein [Fictibacillus barbaricus]
MRSTKKNINLTTQAVVPCPGMTAFFIEKYAIIQIKSVLIEGASMSTLTISILVSLVIIIFVIVIFAAAITKGYSYKHTVDRLEDNPYIRTEEKNAETQKE